MDLRKRSGRSTVPALPTLLAPSLVHVDYDEVFQKLINEKLVQEIAKKDEEIEKLKIKLKEKEESEVDKPKDQPNVPGTVVTQANQDNQEDASEGESDDEEEDIGGILRYSEKDKGVIEMAKDLKVYMKTEDYQIIIEDKDMSNMLLMKAILEAILIPRKYDDYSAKGRKNYKALLSNILESIYRFIAQKEGKIISRAEKKMLNMDLNSALRRLQFK